MTARSARARAKSIERLSSRLRSLREARSNVDWCFVPEKTGESAVIVGFSLKFKSVPLVDRARGLSHF